MIAHYECRDIGYGVECGEVLLPPLAGPDWTGKSIAALILAGVALAGVPATTHEAAWECSPEDGWVSLVANGTTEPTPPLPALPCL